MSVGVQLRPPPTQPEQPPTHTGLGLAQREVEHGPGWGAVARQDKGGRGGVGSILRAPPDGPSTQGVTLKPLGLKARQRLRVPVIPGQ